MGDLPITLPSTVAALLQTLHGAGHSAYVVGGCVRDSLLGLAPDDWDICTSAHPEEVKRLFAGDELILNGEKHGTVSLLRGGTMYEITTYRVDGTYADGRHPSAVRFVPDVREDLARRDFTVNAMAYTPGTGLVDAFGGQGDLAAKTLRCVGEPAERFSEDALRVLRAVRFAAQLGFALEPATAAAALHARDSVQQVSAERIYAELDKLLTGAAAGQALAQYGEILTGAMPEIAPCIGCTQPGRWHCYDVWQHTAVAVGALDVSGQDERGARLLRWAVFLHDMAKPRCRTVGSDGAAHFYGHNAQGGKLARLILKRLKAPVYLIEGASALVAIHDGPVPGSDTEILQALGRYGAPFLRRLCAVKRADLDAHARTAAVAARKAEVNEFEARLCQLAKTGCYTVGMLKINGKDAIAAGISPGPAVGKALYALLCQVMSGSLPNERAALLAALAKRGGKEK